MEWISFFFELRALVGGGWEILERPLSHCCSSGTTSAMAAMCRVLPAGPGLRVGYRRRCKRNEVPMEKIFNKSLLSKFAWSMDCDPEFRF